MNTTLHLYTKHNHIQVKTTKTYLSFQNGAKWPFFVSRHFDFGENLKNYFSKGIFQWNLVIIGDHKYINIAEIEIGIFFIPVEI